jgi:hypothetical protein
MTEQETTPQQQPAPEETLKTEIPTPENVVTDESEEKEEIDLNHLFPDAETDLNELFPEPEMRALLKKVRRNTKDLGKMKERFSDSFSEPDSD